MKTSIKSLVPLLVLTGMAFGNLKSNAAEPGGQTVAPRPAQVESRTPGKAPSSALVGKIVAVDKNKRTISLDIQGRVFAFKMSPQTAVLVNDKPMNVEALAPGQLVELIARRSPDGRFEIVSLAVQPNPQGTQTAGSPTVPTGSSNKAAKSGANMPKYVQSLPSTFRTEPNPANVSGGTISPK